MKKMLVLVLVLGMASIANAGYLLELTVNGGPNPGEIWLEPSDWIEIDVEIAADPGGFKHYLQSYDADLIIDSPQAAFQLPLWNDPIGPPVGYWQNIAFPTGPPSAFDFAPPTVLNSATMTPQWVEIGGTGNDGIWAFSGDVLMNELMLHCEEPTDVVLTLSVNDDAGWAGWYGGVDEFTPGSGFLTDGQELDSLIIHQIPEPMTMTLLGLGGLALIRRRR